MSLGNEQCRILVEQGRLTEDQARYSLRALQGQQIDLCELLVTWGHIGESTADMVRLLVTQGSQSKVFGNYEILGELSRGGMGVVYRARHSITKKVVALKLMLDGSDPEESLRFRREAQALAKVQHPNIVPIFDCSDHNNVPYFTMELVEGKDLQTYIQDEFQSTGSPPDWEWSCKVISQVADALVECHKLGLCHRDIKPQNILIRNDSEEPVIVDFGLVKAQVKTNPGESIALSLTSEGQMLGTPTFMAPEQFEAIKGATGAPADVWSLAGTLYFCLTGGRPFDGDDLIYIFCSIKNGFDDSKLLVKNYSAPEAVSELLRDCFSLEGAERPSMDYVRELLEHVLEEHASEPPFPVFKALIVAASLFLIGVFSVMLIVSMSTPQASVINDNQAKKTPDLKTQNSVFITFQSPMEQGILENAGSVRVNVVGESPAKVSINGQAFPPEKRSYTVSLKDQREIAVEVTGQSGQVTSRALEVVSASMSKLALGSVKNWSKHEDWKKILIAKELESFLKGQGYRFDTLREFRAGGQSHKLAVFTHKRTGLIFHLLPGGRIEVGTANVAETLRFCQLHANPSSQLIVEKLIQLEHPVSKQRVRPFLMSSHEVSVSIWKSQLNASRTIKGSNDWDSKTDFRAGQPMIGVPWKSANQWLGMVGDGFRLPFESEWEYACRAGTDTHFFWGNDTKSLQANIQRSGNGRKLRQILEDVAFAENRTNAFGMVHMIGNASEWVFEVFQSYDRGQPQKAPFAHTLRGGNIFSDLAEARSRSRRRFSIEEDPAKEAIGFRVAVDLPRGFLKN